MFDLHKCTICPRECRVDRLNNQIGYCKSPGVLTAARAALHYWEEPCISGDKGSGTVFFSGCQLGCVYCQNYNIASGEVRKEISVERLAEIFIELQEQGANNINLVTPTHYVPWIINAVEKSRNQGMILPIVYNTGGYEKVDTIKMLEGIVDIYLPDMKYKSWKLAKKYSNAPDYFEVCSKAIEEMVRQVSNPVFDENEELMIKGVIVRHLTLPGAISDSKDIIEYLYNKYENSIYISIMNQFTPLENVRKYPELNRRITEAEYEELVNYAIEIGVENGFIQEGDTAKESYIPSFDIKGI